MKNLILAALVLGLFGAIAPACGEIMTGDNVTFLTFDEEGKSVLDTGMVWNVSEDGELLLIYMPPNYMTVISRWFVYSDETAANQLLTNLLMSSETYEQTEPAATDAFGEAKGWLGRDAQMCGGVGFTQTTTEYTPIQMPRPSAIRVPTIV